MTDFVCSYTYEFWLSLCKIVRSSVLLLLPLFIEDEIKECLETHAAPIKKAIDNQQKNIESNKEKICKQYICLDRLDKQVKRNENTVQNHDAELESVYKKLA